MQPSMKKKKKEEEEKKKKNKVSSSSSRFITERDQRRGVRQRGGWAQNTKLPYESLR